MVEFFFFSSRRRHTRSLRDWSSDVCSSDLAMELAITDALDPDAAAPLARVDVAAPSARMFQDGDVTWLMARDWASGAAWLQAVDLSDPLHPALRGRLDLAAGQGGGFYPLWWGYGDEAVLVGHALAVHDARWFCPGGCATAGGAEPARVVDRERMA